METFLNITTRLSDLAFVSPQVADFVKIYCAILQTYIGSNYLKLSEGIRGLALLKQWNIYNKKT